MNREKALLIERIRDRRKILQSIYVQKMNVVNYEKAKRDYVESLDDPATVVLPLLRLPSQSEVIDLEVLFSTSIENNPSMKQALWWFSSYGYDLHFLLSL